MKTKKNKKTPRVYLISFFVLLIVIMFSLIIIVKPWQKNNKIDIAPNAEDTQINQINYDKPTEEQVDLGIDIKKSSLENEKNIDNNFSVAITNIFQKSNNLFIDTLIGYVTNQGRCTLEISDGKNVYNKVSVTQSLPTTSICKDLSVDIAKTGLNSGNWNFKLTVKVNEMTSETTTSKYIEVIN